MHGIGSFNKYQSKIVLKIKHVGYDYYYYYSFSFLPTIIVFPFLLSNPVSLTYNIERLKCIYYYYFDSSPTNFMPILCAPFFFFFY